MPGAPPLLPRRPPGAWDSFLCPSTRSARGSGGTFAQRDDGERHERHRGTVEVPQRVIPPDVVPDAVHFVEA